MEKTFLGFGILISKKLENVERVITAGLRSYDAASSIKTAGYPIEKIIPCTSIKRSSRQII